MTRPRLLDLFCGAGGAAMGYHQAGFDVVGVDNRPQPNYPFEFHQADALDFLEAMCEWIPLDAFVPYAAIHASPPCQAHSAMSKGTGVAHRHADLVAPTRELLEQTGLPYVIENVVGAPLRAPFMICGSSFGLGVRRHRLFETNFPIGLLPPCSHYSQPEPIDVTGTGAARHVELRRNGRKPRGLQEARDVMGIDWMTRRELSQAIPPAYTELVGHQLLAHVRAKTAA